MSFSIKPDPNGTKTELVHGSKVGLTLTNLGAFLDSDAEQDMQPVTLRQAGSIGSPPGAVVAFAMVTPPNGWLTCNGQAVSRITYSRLFTAIGTAFGAGDGTTTFNLPDLRGEFIRGWDEGRGADTGRGFGSWQDAYAGYNNVTAYSDDGDADGNSPFKSMSGFTINGVSVFDNYTGARSGQTWSIPVIANGARPRNVALRYCIKT